MKKDFIESFGTILVERGLLSVIDLTSLHNDFRKQSDISFEDFLLEEGLVNKPQLLEALSEYYDVPAVDVRGEFFSHHKVNAFPKAVMIRHNFIPLSIDNDNLTVVAANPNDPNLRSIIGEYVTHYIIFNVGIAQHIKDAVREFYDESITYQPDDIANQLMERSQQEVHPMSNDEIVQKNKNEHVPDIWEETIDDYESK